MQIFVCGALRCFYNACDLAYIRFGLHTPESLELETKYHLLGVVMSGRVEIGPGLGEITCSV